MYLWWFEHNIRIFVKQNNSSLSQNLILVIAKLVCLKVNLSFIFFTGHLMMHSTALNVRNYLLVQGMKPETFSKCPKVIFLLVFLVK